MPTLRDHPFDPEDPQHLAMLGGIVARHHLEDIHAQHIPDELMREINPIIRNAFFTALHAARTMGTSGQARRYVDYQLQHAPLYWEEPELLEGYLKSLKRSGEGVEPRKASTRDPEVQAALPRIREMIDWIAELPKIGAPLRGPKGTQQRRVLEEYAVDKLAKAPRYERHDAHLLVDKDYYRLAFLQMDMIERVKAMRPPRSSRRPSPHTRTESSAR